MTTYGVDVNLAELRGQLVRRVALLLIVASGLAMWRALSWEPFPRAPFGLAAALLVMGWCLHVLIQTRPALARHLMVWGLTGGLLAAMALFPEPWLPFLGLMLVFVSAMLVSGGGFATAGAVVAIAAWLTLRDVRAYPLFGLLVVLVIGVALAWLMVHTLYNALEWSWSMQQKADQLLELARDRQGELNRTLKSLDMSNAILHRTQRELIAARRQAEEARLMKEQFTANVSHELRTPLNLILGFSELMYRSPEVYGAMAWPSKLRRAVYQIYQNSRHLLEMIDDVLDLSRVEMVGFTLNKEPTSLEPLLRDAVEIAEDLFQGRPVHLEIDVALDLPPLEIDRTRMRQVLLNLLNNAARFTEMGRVRIAAAQIGGEVVVSVSDTGPGIPAEKLPHVFEEFYQADQSLRRRHGGTGLGLAISKRFVDAHDGRIWVESEEGAGSTFSFALPAPDQTTPLSRLHVSRPLTASSERALAPVIVLDSDPAVVDLVRRHVGPHDVVQVADSDRLLEAVRLHHPQAVICNIPPIERERNIRREPIPVPVPLVECSLPSRAWMVDKLAVSACLTKPVSVEQLRHEIERLGDVHDVLIVDDERGFCQLIEQMLEAIGSHFEVRHAYDGAEGLTAIRERRPDLLLLDLGMPNVDGFQVLATMRGDAAMGSIPVVLLTAQGYVEDALDRCGDRMVIRRPGGLRPAEVLRCLKAVIDVLEPRYDELLALESPLTSHPIDAARPGRRPG
ncbi:MAG TPA: response regulator [Chloroflexi bacterium]|nr:response regulator [Chloroflexota bacterium]